MPPIEAGIPALVDAACLKQWQRAVFRSLARGLEVLAHRRYRMDPPDSPERTYALWNV